MKNCFSLTTKVVFSLLLSGLTTTATAGITTPESKYANRKELITFDQEIGYFKSFGKPWFLKYSPKVNELDMIICGYTDTKTGDIRQFKNGKDLETITPIRFTAKFVDGNVQIDKIYEGWREATLAQLLERGLQLVYLLPYNEYKGTLFVDEYKSNLPMKWVFRDLEDFRGLKAYLARKFKEHNIIAPAEKPLLLVSFDTTNQTLSNEDLEFLTTYYEIVDPTDSLIKNFFDNSQKAVNVAREDTVNAKVILDGYGEMFMRLVEKEFWDLKGKEIIVNAAVYASLAVTAYLLIRLGKDYLEDHVAKPVKGFLSSKGTTGVKSTQPA